MGDIELELTKDIIVKLINLPESLIEKIKEGTATFIVCGKDARDYEYTYMDECPQCQNEQCVRLPGRHGTRDLVVLQHLDYVDTQRGPICSACMGGS